MRCIFILFAILLVTSPVQAQKKRHLDRSARILFYETINLAEPNAASDNRQTSFCNIEDNDLLVADTTGTDNRCFIPAGFKLVINRVSVDATDEIGTDDCLLSLYKNGVAESWSTAAIGDSSTPTVCDFKNDVDDDDRIEISGDSCTQLNAPGTIFEPDDYPSVGSIADGGTCTDPVPTQFTVVGYWEPPRSKGNYSKTASLHFSINAENLTKGDYGGCNKDRISALDSAASQLCAVPAGTKLIPISLGIGVNLVTSLSECRVCLEKNLVTLTSSCIDIGGADMNELGEYKLVDLRGLDAFTDTDKYGFEVIDSSGGGTCEDGVSDMQRVSAEFIFRTELE